MAIVNYDKSNMVSIVRDAKPHISSYGTSGDAATIYFVGLDTALRNTV